MKCAGRFQLERGRHGVTLLPDTATQECMEINSETVGN